MDLPQAGVAHRAVLHARATRRHAPRNGRRRGRCAYPRAWWRPPGAARSRRVRGAGISIDVATTSVGAELHGRRAAAGARLWEWRGLTAAGVAALRRRPRRRPEWRAPCVVGASGEAALRAAAVARGSAAGGSAASGACSPRSSRMRRCSLPQRRWGGTARAAAAEPATSLTVALDGAGVCATLSHLGVRAPSVAVGDGGALAGLAAAAVGRLTRLPLRLAGGGAADALDAGAATAAAPALAGVTRTNAVWGGGGSARLR